MRSTRSYRSFVPDERENKPTALMPRDELLPLVNATSTPAVSAHTLPRVLLDRRVRSSNDALEIDDGRGSPSLVLAIICVLIALFIMIVVTAH